MSNRQHPKRPTIVEYLHRELQGQRMPGGCEDCNAYQTMDKQTDSIYFMTIHHDDTCPFYRQHRKEPI